MPAPDFRFEKIFWRWKYRFIAGVDEVGRGSFAGPVVAGCIVFSEETIIPQDISVNDSKKVSSGKREEAAMWIKENSLAWGIGEAPASLINRIGMAKATKRAFRKAISEARKRLGKPIDYLLIDAFFIPFVAGLPTKRRKDTQGRFRKNPKGKQTAIVGGDEKSLTIAAASIIAKVYRDKLMASLSKKRNLKKYGWGTNKGYGTKQHQRALKKYGLTRYHRKEFVNSFFSSPSR